MTVQELLDQLNKIEDKNLAVMLEAPLDMIHDSGEYSYIELNTVEERLNVVVLTEVTRLN